MSLWQSFVGGLLGLLARDAASLTPPASDPHPTPPPQPVFDATAMYNALLGMGAIRQDITNPFQLYSTRDATPADMERLFRPAVPPRGVVPEGERPMAMDDINNPMVNFGAGAYYGFTEGMFWLGFPYLAELAQRTEYRRIAETIAKDMTRRWFRLQAKGKDDKSDKIAELEDCIKNHKLREKFTLLALLDGFFGRAHLYLDTGQGEDRGLMKLPLPVDPRTIPKGGLKGIRVVEPIWCYPNAYNASDPLRDSFYLPQTWWVMGKEIHRTRVLPFIGREMPDMLKPAYSFAGLSLSQMAKPYVDNWLRTRQSVSDLIHSFSTPVIQTNMGSVLNSGASDQLKMRAALFNYFRDNNNLMVLDKTTEDFKNVSAPLGSLDHLQAQAQEHMASAVGIPLVVLLGISPSGLNATSEGELQVWAQFIRASQTSFFDAHLVTVLNVMQLSLWGAIDPDITHAWEPLREMSEQEEAQARKSDADLDAVYVNAGVLSPDEIRQKLSGESDSPYQGLDLTTPAPQPPQQEPDPLAGGAGGLPDGGGGPGGAGGAPPGTAGGGGPAGGSPAPVPSGPGHLGPAGSPKPPDPKGGSRDAVNDNPMDDGPGKGHIKVVTEDPDAEVHVHLGPNDRGHVQLGADEWDESQVKRDKSGQFSSTGGGGGGASRETSGSKAAASGSQTFTKSKPASGSLNGVKFAHWHDHPTTSAGWQAEADAGPAFDEPEVPPLKGGRKQGAGVIIQEPDGRVWMIRPKGAFGGYKASFPKGGVDSGDTLRSTAIKEAFEESGLRVELTGFAGDAMRDTSQARYYYAKRIGGTPDGHGWETEGVTLAPPGELHQHLNKPIDRKIAEHVIEGADEEAPLDLTGMEKIGGQLGSNPGGQYEDEHGRKFYAKQSKSEDHAKNELLATRLYEAARAPVLHTMPATVGGKLGTASEWQSKTNINPNSKTDRRDAQKNFATHAWLANWDAPGLTHDNQARIDGIMHTVDTGGSLLYRAQGGPKGAAFGNTVGEWESMRHPVSGIPDATQAHELFGEMTPSQLRRSAANVTAIPSHVIEALVAKHGPGDAKAKAALAEKLIARRDDIAAKVAALPADDPAHDAAMAPLRALDALIGEWDEEAHPRAKSGQFAAKGAGEAGGGGEAPKPHKPAPELTKYAGPAGAKMKQAVEHHMASGHDSPHELVAQIKAEAGKYKSTNVSGYLNQLITHLEQHHGLAGGSLGKSKAKGKPGAVGAEGGPPEAGAPSEAEMEQMAAAEPEPTPEPAADPTTIPDIPDIAKNYGAAVNIHSMATKGYTKAAGLQDYLDKSLQGGSIQSGGEVHAFANAVIAAKAAQEAAAGEAAPPKEAEPTGPAPKTDLQTTLMKAAQTPGTSAQKLAAMQSWVDQTDLTETDETFKFAQKWADSLYGGAGGKLTPATPPEPKPAGPPPQWLEPNVNSKHQPAVYAIATDPNKTAAEKIAAMKEYPTVVQYPNDFTAKFANSWIKQLGGEPIPGVGFVPGDPSVPKPAPPPPKPPPPKSAAAKAAAAAPKTPKHGSLTAPENAQVLQIPASPDLSHALTLEAKTKKPASTLSPESSEIVPTMQPAFWAEVAHGKDAQAFQDYGGGGYHAINGVLRGNEAKTPDAISKIHAMRAIFNDPRTKITEDLQLIRGEEMSADQIKKIRDGLANSIGSYGYTRTGFTSASIGVNPNTGKPEPGYMAGANTYWHFQCEKGTPVLGIAGKVGHHEREVILNHHQMVEIYEVYHDGKRTHIKATVR